MWSSLFVWSLDYLAFLFHYWFIWSVCVGVWRGRRGLAHWFVFSISYLAFAKEGFAQFTRSNFFCLSWYCIEENCHFATFPLEHNLNGVQILGVKLSELDCFSNLVPSIPMEFQPFRLNGVFSILTLILTVWQFDFLEPFEKTVLRIFQQIAMWLTLDSEFCVIHTERVNEHRIW